MGEFVKMGLFLVFLVIFLTGHLRAENFEINSSTFTHVEKTKNGPEMLPVIVDLPKKVEGKIILDSNIQEVFCEEEPCEIDLVHIDIKNGQEFFIINVGTKSMFFNKSKEINLKSYRLDPLEVKHIVFWNDIIYEP